MRPSIVYAFVRYEMKRSIARKKVIALAFFTFLIGTLPYYVLSSSPDVSSIIPLEDYPYLWVAGIFAPQLFIQFMAILIAAGAMSEEYEQGTAELLLSKPVTRAEYFAGKYVGGYILLLFVIALGIVLSLLSATVTFGRQQSLGALPGIYAVESFAAILFYSTAFAAGELVRRSSLSYIISSAAFFTSQILGIYLSIIFSLTGKAFYEQVNYYLPTSPVNSLPAQFAQNVLPPSIAPLLQLIGASSPIEPTMTYSVFLIVAYFVAALIASVAYFHFADISKKIS